MAELQQLMDGCLHGTARLRQMGIKRAWFGVDGTDDLVWREGA